MKNEWLVKLNYSTQYRNLNYNRLEMLFSPFNNFIIEGSFSLFWPTVCFHTYFFIFKWRSPIRIFCFDHIVFQIFFICEIFLIKDSFLRVRKFKLVNKSNSSWAPFISIVLIDWSNQPTTTYRWDYLLLQKRSIDMSTEKQWVPCEKFKQVNGIKYTDQVLLRYDIMDKFFAIWSLYMMSDHITWIVGTLNWVIITYMI